MRLGPLFLALLLAGCVQPSAQDAPPAADPPRALSLLPPGLLLDRSPQGNVQVYVHAKQGNVRYDWVNLTIANDFDRGANWTRESRPFADAYAVDDELGHARVNLTVDAVEGDAHFRWSGRVLLDSGPTARARIEAWSPDDPASHAFNATLPYETYLVRLEERP